MDNKEGAEPILYRYKLEWKTHEDPCGNNGPHSLAAYGQIQFQKWDVDVGWTDDYDGGPAAKLANCTNVYMADATASNGTIDYFKWDPDGDVSLAEPHVTFTIKDADPHKYKWIVYYRSTSGSRTWGGSQYWSASGTVDSGGGMSTEVDINLANSAVSGHLDRDVHERDTYTYDIYVLEYEGCNRRSNSEACGGVKVRHLSLV
ncbi:MAG: hypothetical protein PVF54_07460 [Anaerolineae bacterium]